MEKNIKQILSDIYSIDPSLKSKEGVLLGIIQELLAARPDSKVNQEFINNLRLKLINERSKSTELKPINNMFNFLSKKFIFSGAAALCLVAVVTFLVLQDNSGQLAIKNVGSNAFGELILDSAHSEPARESEDAAAQNSPQPTKATSGIEVPLGMGAGGTATSPMVPPYYESTNYRYVYQGGDLELASQGNVYKRTADSSLSSQLAKVIGKMNLGIFNLSKLQNMKVNTMEIAEDKDYGYSLYVDFRQNTLSISMNWEKWPARENAGQAQEMGDGEIVAVADKFLADYGVNTKNYGQGEVQSTRSYGLMKAEPAIDRITETYIRDYANVIYPMVINGEQVYDQSGQKYGIGVTVDLTYGRVTSAYNINTGSFESSTYNLEADAAKIIKFVEAGGMYGNYSYPEATKTVDIEVGQPVKGILLTWQWDSAKSSSNELFVPALIFPTNSQDVSGRAYITVPLVGELLNQNNDVRITPTEEVVKPL